MPLCPADDATLDAAIADLRTWDARHVLTAEAGRRRDAMVARVAVGLERVANAEEATELPDALRLFPYGETLNFYEFAVIASDVAGVEDAREARLAAVALPARLRAAQQESASAQDE